MVTAATYARMSRSDTLADGRPTGYGWGLYADRLAADVASAVLGLRQRGATVEGPRQP